MTDTDRDAHLDSAPLDDPHPDSGPGVADDDGRSDIEQEVEARSDAVARGEGGREPDLFEATGMPDGPGGIGGLTKNQDHDQQ